MGHAAQGPNVTAGTDPVTSGPRRPCPWCDRDPIAGAGPAHCHQLETTTLMTDIPAPATSRVPSIVPILNPIIRRLLGAGLPFGPNVLLTVRGRRTGEPRTFPVAILELDGRRYVQSPFGEVNWVRNLRVAGEAVVTRGRERETVSAVEVPPEAGGPILRDALAPFFRSRLLAPVAGRLFHLRPGASLDEYVEESRRHPMFELRSRPSPASPSD